MGNINFNLNGIENLIIQKAQDRATEQAVAEVVDAVVEKTAEAVEPKPDNRTANSQQNENTLKADSSTIIAAINKATVSGAQPAMPVLTKVASNNSGGAVSGEENGTNGVNPRDGEGLPEIPTNYDEFEAFWANHKNDELDDNDVIYNWLMQALDSFITCCINDNRYLEEAMWRSRRVQLRNKRRQKEYNEMLDFLRDGGDYSKLKRHIQHWDIANGQYGSDNEDITIIRQRLANLPETNQHYIDMKIEYNLAMVSVFNSKLKAIYIKLQDPIFASVPPEQHSYIHGYEHELRMNIREFTRFKGGYLSELQRLGWEPDYVEPENNKSPEEIYAELQEEYSTETNIDKKITLVNKLIWYAERIDNPSPSVEYWQQVLIDLGGDRGNTTTSTSVRGAGNSTSAAAAATTVPGGRGGSVTPNFAKGLIDEVENLTPDFLKGNATGLREVMDRSGTIEGDEEEFLAWQEKIDSLYEQYLQEREEAYQQDLLKIILNYVCIMAYERDENHSEYWLSRYKELIAEWRSHDWEEFFPEEGVKKPENI